MKRAGIYTRLSLAVESTVPSYDEAIQILVIDDLRSRLRQSAVEDERVDLHHDDLGSTGDFLIQQLEIDHVAWNQPVDDGRVGVLDVLR